MFCSSCVFGFRCPQNPCSLFLFWRCSKEVGQSGEGTSQASSIFGAAKPVDTNSREAEILSRRMGGLNVEEGEGSGRMSPASPAPAGTERAQASPSPAPVEAGEAQGAEPGEGTEEPKPAAQVSTHKHNHNHNHKHKHTHTPNPLSLVCGWGMRPCSWVLRSELCGKADWVGWVCLCVCSVASPRRRMCLPRPPRASAGGGVTQAARSPMGPGGSAAAAATAGAPPL